MLVISTQHTKYKLINFLVFQEIHFEFKFFKNIYKFFAHYVDIRFISISSNIIRQVDSLRAQKSPY